METGACANVVDTASNLVSAELCIGHDPIPPKMIKRDELPCASGYKRGTFHVDDSVEDEGKEVDIADPHTQFTVTSLVKDAVVPVVHTPISSINELKEDMWVIARYDDDFYPAQVLSVYPDLNKAKLKCLEKPYGNHEPQDFEKQKFWVAYNMIDIFECPIKPCGVQVGRSFKWQY